MRRGSRNILTRRTPQFPNKFLSMHTRVLNQTARTNNSVEGWHNAFQSGLSFPHPSFSKLLRYFKREQAIQDVMLLNRRVKYSFPILVYPTILSTLLEEK